MASSNILFASPYAFKDLSFSTLPSLLLVINPRRTRTRTRTRTRRMAASLNLLVAREKDSFGFCDLRRNNRQSGCGFFRRCKGWEREGNWTLEAEILEFMEKSENPENFPTKEELVDAGRMDLVDAIVEQGGWLSYGWDLDNEEQESVSENDGLANWDSIMDQDCGNGILEKRILEGNEVRDFGVNSFDCNSSLSASSSGRSLETEAENDTGIEGILNRLEKQRNMTFGIDLREKGNSTHVSSNDDAYGWHPGSSTDTTVAGHERSRRPASSTLNKGILDDSWSKLTSSNFDASRNSLEPEMWRTWSIQRAGFSDGSDAEIAFNETGNGGAMDTKKDEMLSIKEGATGPIERRKELNSCVKEIDNNPIRTRLQHLELELASALRLLRSKTDEFIAQKGHESSSDDLLKLSDAWEFQENEIMNAQNRLRSIRAKLAVLEGKMALTIIDAQKIVEEKQKRIDDARITLQLLRTACIVWPNSAEEVLLTGSFDGWATQRKMERSNTGIFTVCLKLYPGRYEIKFIVDGIWRIDPLRPIVHSNGYENNLLIIT